MPPISSVPPQNPHFPGGDNAGDSFVPNAHLNPGQARPDPRGVDAGATQGADGSVPHDGPPGQGGPGGGDHDGHVGGPGTGGPGQGSGPGEGNGAGPGGQGGQGGPGGPGHAGGPGGQYGGFGDAGGHGGTPGGGYQAGPGNYGGVGGLISGVLGDATHLISTLVSPLLGGSPSPGSGPQPGVGDPSRPPDHATTYNPNPSSAQADPQPGSLAQSPRQVVDPGRSDPAVPGGRTGSDATPASAAAQPSQAQPAAGRPDGLDPRASQGGAMAQTQTPSAAAQTAAQAQAALLAQQAALMGAMGNAALRLAQDPAAMATAFAQGGAAAPEGRDVATVLPQGVREERDVRDPRNAQQAPADNRRTPSEILAQAFAKAAPDAQVRGNLPDLRAPEQRAVVDAQTRTEADARTQREAADKARNAGVNEAARSLPGDQARRTGLFSGAVQGGLVGGASELMRHAMDWVGQQVREFGFDAQSGSEGVHAMRVIAGLIAASVVVLVAIAVLYALRVILVT